MRVAFVHDWLVTYRGGEKVLEALLDLFPDAPIFTLFYDPVLLPHTISQRQVQTPKFLNFFKRIRKLTLPALPHAIESLPLRDYDLVISTSSCVAKGARTNGKHLCYLHSPMRYIWDQQTEYLKGVSHIPGAKTAIRTITPWLQRWDITSAKNVDRFVVNSTFVGERARRIYQRDSVVIPPPIDLERFRPAIARTKGNRYLLAAGAMVSYKRFDIAISACEATGRRLIVAGSGPMEAKLRHQAGRFTEFIIQPDDLTWADLLSNADALLFPGTEDFGMIAIEAMASGTPVIAYKAGGALDFIEEGVTGLFFSDATPTSLIEALDRLDSTAFDCDALSAYASGYGRDRFSNGCDTKSKP